MPYLPNSRIGTRCILCSIQSDSCAISANFGLISELVQNAFSVLQSESCAISANFGLIPELAQDAFSALYRVTHVPYLPTLV